MKELIVLGGAYLLVTVMMFLVLRGGFSQQMERLRWTEEVQIFGFALLWPVIIYQGMKREK